MNEIRILYIDDELDTELSKYLDNYENCKCNIINLPNIIFEPAKGYQSLLNNDNVRNANIIFIDSRLFENSTASSEKFSGEEFKIILKKLFPYIEVIVITQNPIDDGILTINKYKHNKEINAFDFYAKEISEPIEKAITNIIEMRIISEKIKQNYNIDEMIVDKVINTLNGSNEYDDLRKEDIDSLVRSFKELQDKYDD